MTKKELRRIFKDKRAALTPSELNRLDDLILIQFQQVFTGDASVFLSYQPIPEKQEVNMDLMTDYLSFRIPELRIAYPVIDPFTHTFKAVETDEETTFRLGHYGVPEPIDGHVIDPREIDAAFIPLLAFDERGYRVGYGKGFYDRFLALCRPDLQKIGFSWFDAVPAIDDIDEYDVPLNICITPNQRYEF